ncbi:Protein kinase C-like 1 [Coemansia spiralis]|uniref:Phosphoenolpyruvate carboxykinase (ATP) n=2 Tax=Coemansia TaxID=4863 RepID=A0A9W8G870_9FUNG|nr:phosphoenolpyruvate carboxykinase-domain-containing protein [Coemansia spiralis]KAJ1995281.1 Protein kinase C-like 1 [Coemansia umbellata]KAJ2625682.1 Protein kinase C-like 1 [Coemansia sp. RSA 1358]KAJ2678501.1 Protein kinase C-like 1 [Coemansia spiralis]
MLRPQFPTCRVVGAMQCHLAVAIAARVAVHPAAWVCGFLSKSLKPPTRPYSQAAKTASHAKPSSNHHVQQQSQFSNSLEHSLTSIGLELHAGIRRNASAAQLYEDALHHEPGTAISSTGALIARSGKKTGRSPRDKRVVEEASTVDDVWWGPVNKKLSTEAFATNYQDAVNYLNTRDRLYVFDGFAGWDPKYRIKVRVVCARAYHALFMNNMLIRPTREELDSFGEPDFTIVNAGQFPANRFTSGMTSSTSVAISFERKQMVILGTEYAGEMKKGIFTAMHYLMPKASVLSLHSSCNEGSRGDVSLFFGLSGTGKTTLSADPHRPLIGDDEHVWTESGVFNIEGGCYAKTIDLSAAKEPEIFNAIRFGSVLENVVYDKHTRVVDYADKAITENTRCAYPIEYIPNAKVPCVGGNPKNIVLLTCDAFGVLPPVAKLTPAQAMYHFISGYTAKIAGTEEGVTEPEATFSACFGQPFLVWHPVKYAQMLAQKMQEHSANVWLVNTGWSGGAYGQGKRISLKHSRAIIDAIHSGELETAEYVNYGVFNLQIPVSVSNVPAKVLDPSLAWEGTPQEFTETIAKLARLFQANFKEYADKATQELIAGGPRV